jgi:signal peptidase I
MDAQTDLGNVTKRNLVVDVARTFGQVRLRVTGTSMLPSVWPGDILIINRCRVAELGLGEIVLCYRNEELVAHRLTGKLGNRIVTRGDSLDYYDRPFEENEILGRVLSILRNGRYVDPAPRWWNHMGSWILRRSPLSVRMLLGLRRRLWAG